MAARSFIALAIGSICDRWRRVNRDRCLEQISHRLVAQGWTGDDLTEYILTEMGPLLLDEPRLGADRLASLLAARGRTLPATAAAES